MADQQTIDRLKDKAVEMRKRLLRLAHEAGSLHIGGDLSMTDEMTVIFEYLLNVDPANTTWPDRDRFVLSKGHGAGALYISMANRGFFDVEEIYATYAKLGTRFGVHPCRNFLPGVETSTGSLGHGLSIVVGMGIAARLDGRANRVVTLMGDGELQEGSVWEAVMAAAHYKLGNLVAFIDKNDLQMDGFSDDVMQVNPIDAKFAAFGWNVVTVDGNDIEALVDAVDHLPATDSLKPTVIIGQTVKGKGVSFMENQPAWHAGTVDADTLATINTQLDSARASEKELETWPA
jgi:transketolase